MADEHAKEKTGIRGRGAASNPTSRFDRLVYTPDPGEEPSHVPTELFEDNSKSILTDNDSPDLLLVRTLNPYRGCEHGWPCCQLSHDIAIGGPIQIRSREGAKSFRVSACRMGLALSAAAEAV